MKIGCEKTIKSATPAYVLGEGITGLGVIRGLGRSGVTVYCIAERGEDVSLSRFCKKYYIVPRIEKNVSVLRDFFADGERLKRGGVVFPTSDLYSLHLSELSDELENHYDLLVPKFKVTETLVEKRKFYRSLAELGVPHPKTYFTTSIQTIERISKKLGYPVVLKPSLSQKGRRKLGAKAFIANNATSLLKYYDLMFRQRINVIVQEIIPGADDNMYSIAGYFDKNSYPKALFASHRLRGWPAVFGTGSLIESYPISKLASTKDMVVKYLHQLGYHGIFEAEFKKDPRDGTFKLIEINSRSWWQNSLPALCGINIILIAYCDAIGKKVKYLETYEELIKWTNFLNDLASAIETHTSIKEWISSLKGIQDWSYFAHDDLTPWVKSSLESAKRVLMKLFNG